MKENYWSTMADNGCLADDYVLKLEIRDLRTTLHAALAPGALVVCNVTGIADLRESQDMPGHTRKGRGRGLKLKACFVVLVEDAGCGLTVQLGFSCASSSVLKNPSCAVHL